LSQFSSVQASTFISLDKDVRGSVLCLVMRELGLPLAIDTFDVRKTLQKLVFIAQKAGVGIGYSYRWHLYGPYSTELSKTYYSIASNPAEYDRQTKDLKLKPEVVKILGSIKSALGTDIKSPELLEAMASSLYLGSRDIDKLTLIKPTIGETTWKTAFQKLDALKLD